MAYFSHDKSQCSNSESILVVHDLRLDKNNMKTSKIAHKLNGGSGKNHLFVFIKRTNTYEDRYVLNEYLLQMKEIQHTFLIDESPLSSSTI